VVKYTHIMTQNISKITTVHLELTDKCQAQCPMCARNYHGGPTRPFIKNGDISIDDFKKWFPKNFLRQLQNFYSCGNYGDPAFARDCLEIYSYVRDCNPHTRLALHTNGGMRNSEWWSKLAKAIGTVSHSTVVFAIDGFKGKHELYRRNTNFDKVIENMKAYIEGGGIARVDSLVFKHNEDEVEELEKFLLGLGVHSVNFISTTRFYEMKKFKVVNANLETEYYLEPTTRKEFIKYPNAELTNLLDEQYRKDVFRSAIISPRCVNEDAIYVDPYGNITPCCYIGGDYLENPIEETLPIHTLRNQSVENTKTIMKDIGVYNCKSGILGSDGYLFTGLDRYWHGENKCMTCVKACSNAIVERK
jgi:MoaA/NifB/PqqE/SkfB family radical SAM enzyme